MTQRKTPVRVFVTPDVHSRLLIQVGTHHTTPSMLGEAIIRDGLDRLERGDVPPLNTGSAPASASES
ncbi:hypothetical protein [Kushneria aurantia]|uniref:Uncharacterized protein n=1 Tax=Kushneria aurantia TaxID=504092 RepID=A0ABV6G1N3_9GAMM|nr:hypothetical protein [Kushneria aurantia]